MNQILDFESYVICISCTYGNYLFYVDFRNLDNYDKCRDQMLQSYCSNQTKHTLDL